MRSKIEMSVYEKGVVPQASEKVMRPLGSEVEGETLHTRHSGGSYYDR